MIPVFVRYMVGQGTNLGAAAPGPRGFVCDNVAVVWSGGCQTERQQCSITSRECIDVPGTVFCHCYEGYAGLGCKQGEFNLLLY